METEYPEAKEQRQGKLLGGQRNLRGRGGSAPSGGPGGSAPKLKPFYAKIVIEALLEHVFPC